MIIDAQKIIYGRTTQNYSSDRHITNPSGLILLLIV